MPKNETLFTVLKGLFLSLRPKQWIKNGALFAPLLFSQNLFNRPLLIKTLEAFVLFCLLAGSVYIINDLKDLKEDRLHPTKRNRPLASGKVRPAWALIFAVVIMAVSFIGGWAISLPFLEILGAYLLLQVIYTFSLKNQVILDIFSIAAGFVLRVVAGGLAIGVQLSPWLFICTTLLSLFLAMAKRRHELVLLKEDATEHRQILKEYSPYLLDQMMGVVTATTVMSYALYTISEETIAKFHTANLIFTLPFVLYGIFRYLYLVHQKVEGGRPEEILLTDRPLLLTILGWTITVLVVLYH
ncbi:MAG: decaprenyl-phosphate phosphoribosyltransferase [Deltaproteobacteria bacterium]|nr:decaprenyl-phosphate phosphoribosyltransferase [Deltaproteobacteria bacterium]